MTGDERRDLLTTTEVAGIFRVDPRTVMRWVREGKLPVVPTPGGRMRFERAEIERRRMPVRVMP